MWRQACDVRNGSKTLESMEQLPAIDDERTRMSAESASKELTTSSPALICTAVGHESVLSVSTIPSVGLNARFAMPVLNLRLGMSTMAVPVVSLPVPAVVGTDFINYVSWAPHNIILDGKPAINGRSVLVIGRPFPTGALIKS